MDDRKRDLAGASLIAHQLDAQGIDCFLEPLEAYRAVLAAYRPAMIIFNHVQASHLVDWSRHLARMGVLVGVLPNEGIAYDRDQLRFAAGRHHSGAHIDLFFCWNEVHRQALLEAGVGEKARVEVVGVPRFDFYFEPWARAFRLERAQPRERPNLLLCTNFSAAKFHDLPRARADKFYAPWKQHMPLFRDYWQIVEDQHFASRRVLDYAGALAATGKYDIVFRPHPREYEQAYLDWMARLPAAQRERVRLDSTTNITSLILDCDLEISCETCTTALDSWIAGKPTVELLFRKNPALYYPEHAACSTSCDSPEALPGLVERLLRDGEDPAVLAARQRHLQKWCNAPSGKSSERLAVAVAEAVRAARAPQWSQLTLADRRRSAKLRLFRNLGLAYHFDPLMPVKMKVARGRYAIKKYSYDKSIKPRHVAEARRRLAAALAK